MPVSVLVFSAFADGPVEHPGRHRGHRVRRDQCGRAQGDVTVHNDGTNQELHLTADDSGFFKAPLLEPGSYTVTTTAAGFAGHEDKVVVQVGQVTNVAPHLGVTGTVDTVSVTADVPVLNFDSPDFASNVNKRAINDIPINNRRWSALALQTPGVVVDSNGYGLISVRGVSTLLNNIEIDGADDNQAYFSEERGRTREAYSTSAAAVREFQVNTGVYAAEYGRAAGGVINSVTSSGTNQIHGQAYFYDRESKFNAYNDQSTIPQVSAAGTVTQVPFKPKDLRKIYGFSAGGPIIKNKLFFFYTYDQHSRIFPLSGVANVPSSVNNTSSYGFNALPDAALPGAASCNTTTGYLTVPTGTTVTDVLDAQACTLAARLGLGSYAAGAALYQTDLNALNGDLGIIPRTGYQEINTPKLDYQVNSKQHVEVLFHRLRWDSPGGVQTNATGAYSLDSTGTDFVKLDYGLAKLTSLVRSNISNELLYQYSRELDDEGQQPFSAYSKNVLQQADGDVPYVTLDTKIGANFGSPYYSYRPAYPDERKWQIGDTLYVSRGNNSFKFGVDIVHNYDLTNQASYYEGNYVYSQNLANYFADLGARGHGVCDASQQVAASTATNSAVGVYPCYNTYQQGFGPTTFDFSTLDYGFFGQDNYKITPRLTLELGLRYDYEKLPSAVPSLIAPTGNFVPYNGIGNNSSDKNNFGPRVGFSYDVYGTGLTVLRGGFGMYYGRILNGSIGTVVQTTGSPLAQTTPTVSASTGLASEPFFGNRFSATQLTSSAKPAAFFRAPNLQNPQILEFDLQVQQQIGHGTFAQVSYLGALGRELPNFLNVNLNPAAYNATTNPGGVRNVNVTVVDATGKSPIPNGTVISVPTFTSYGNTALLGPSATNFTSITEYLSNVTSNYNAVVFEIQNRTFRSIQFDGSYTFAHALDYNQNASSTTSTNSWYNPYGNARVNYGNSQFNIPNRFVGYVLYNFPGIDKSHHLLSYATNGWSLDNTFQFQTGNPFTANTSGSNSTPAISTGFNGSGGTTFIPQLGHNNFALQRILLDDVRIEKNFPITERTNLKVFLQAFNVANHQNESTANTTAFQLAKGPTPAAGATPTGTATYQANFGTVSKTNNSGFSYTPRQLELAARLFF